MRGFWMGGVHALVVGHKTNSVFIPRPIRRRGVTSVYKANTNTGAIRKLVDLPAKRNIVSVNADETLAAGTYIVGDAAGREYGSNVPPPPARRQARRTTASPARRRDRIFSPPTRAR
jgi:oligogalacturonide lyase